MRAKSITFSAETGAIPLNHYESPFDLSIQLKVTGGTVTVQHTYNDPFNGETLNWINHSSLASKTSGTYDGSYSAPVRAVRVTGTTPAGTITLVQSRQK